MYMSETIAGDRNFRADINDASTFKDIGDGFRDYPEHGEKWVTFGAGATTITVRMTIEQMNDLANALGQAVQDAKIAMQPLPDRDPTPPADYWGEPLEVNDSQ